MKWIKMFTSATGPKDTLEAVSKEMVGRKVYPAVQLPLQEEKGISISPISFGQIIDVKIVEGGFLSTLELYDEEVGDV